MKSEITEPSPVQDASVDVNTLSDIEPIADAGFGDDTQGIPDLGLADAAVEDIALVDAVAPEDTSEATDSEMASDVPEVDVAAQPDGVQESDTQTPDAGLPAEVCDWSDLDSPKSASLEVVVVDSWGQAIEGASGILWGPGNEKLAEGSHALLPVDLCGPVQLNLTIAAPNYYTHQGVISYDGQATLESVSVVGDPAKVAWVLEVQYVEAHPTYKLYVGLTHRFFAASGPPARRGNLVTLYTSPADAHEAFYDEAMATAWELVTVSTWWWESDFELVRGDGAPPFLSKESRWPLTVMGLIESLKPFGVEFKVLVNQFLSQDGVLSDVNIDEVLLDSVVAGDVEYMGQYNDASGKFTVDIDDVDLQERLEASGMLSKGVAVKKQLLSVPVAPQNVDMTDLPLGLDAIDIPHASWHQKFFTIDQAVAYIGGINFDVLDWDSGEMTVFDPRRMPFEANASARQKVYDKEEPSAYPTRRDYMLRTEGPVVKDAMEVFHTRWHDLADAGVAYSDYATPFELLGPLSSIVGGVHAQVVTTMPAPYERYEILETLVRAIGQAEDYIFIEDQYFRAPILADAISKRLVEAPELVVIAVINPISEWTDPGCWQTLVELNQLKTAAAGRFGVFRVRSFDAYDSGCFFCFDETVGVFSDTFIHSKLVIIDDLYFQMGSANHNNRGLVFEGEMATVVVDSGWVKAARDAVAEALLGATYAPDSKGLELLQQFKAQGDWNDSVYEEWLEEGMDIDLDGDPLPSKYAPKGHIYPIPFSVPDDCLIEGVGKDIM